MKSRWYEISITDMRHREHYWRNRKAVSPPSDKGTGAFGLLGKNDTWPGRFYGDATRVSGLPFRKVRIFQRYRKMSRFRCLREKFSWQTPEAPTLRRFGYCSVYSKALFHCFSSRPSKRDRQIKAWKTKTRTHQRISMVTCNINRACF